VVTFAHSTLIYLGFILLELDSVLNTKTYEVNWVEANKNLPIRKP